MYLKWKRFILEGRRFRRDTYAASWVMLSVRWSLNAWKRSWHLEVLNTICGVP